MTHAFELDDVCVGPGLQSVWARALVAVGPVSVSAKLTHDGTVNIVPHVTDAELRYAIAAAVREAVLDHLTKLWRRRDDFQREALERGG